MIVVAYVICAIVWGTTWFAIRVSIGSGGYPTVLSASLRFTIAASVLGVLWMLGRIEPTPHKRRTFVWLAIAGLFNACGYALVYRAEESVPGSIAAVLFGLYPLATAALATITRTEAVSRSQLGGAVIALVGVALIFSDRLAISAQQAVGIVMLLGAVCCASVYGVIIKREGKDLNPLASTAVFLSVTALGLWVAAPAFGEIIPPWPPPLKPSLAILYLAIFGSLIAFASYFYLLKHISLMASTTLVFIQPMIAVAVDAMFERHANLKPLTFLGMAVVLAGVLLSVIAAEWSRRARRK